MRLAGWQNDGLAEGMTNGRSYRMMRVALLCCCIGGKSLLALLATPPTSCWLLHARAQRQACYLCRACMHAFLSSRIHVPPRARALSIPAGRFFNNPSLCVCSKV